VSRASLRTTPDVRPREEENGDEAGDDQCPGHRELHQPAGARNRSDPEHEEHDQDDEVEGPVEDDRAEGSSGRHARGESQPAGAQEVADAARKHVVHGHAAHGHLDEAGGPDFGGCGDPAPARRLQDVDDSECRDGEPHEPWSRVAQRSPDGLQVGVADGEPEEHDADRDAHERDERAEAPGCHARRIYPWLRSVTEQTSRGRLLQGHVESHCSRLLREVPADLEAWYATHRDPDTAAAVPCQLGPFEAHGERAVADWRRVALRVEVSEDRVDVGGTRSCQSHTVVAAREARAAIRRQDQHGVREDEHHQGQPESEPAHVSSTAALSVPRQAASSRSGRIPADTRTSDAESRTTGFTDSSCTNGSSSSVNDHRTQVIPAITRA
jgi:hypothetical protein